MNYEQAWIELRARLEQKRATMCLKKTGYALRLMREIELDSKPNVTEQTNNWWHKINHFDANTFPPHDDLYLVLTSTYSIDVDTWSNLHWKKYYYPQVIAWKKLPEKMLKRELQ
jgi:hypothetical protein